MDISFLRQVILEAVGPVVAAIVGTLIIGSAAAWIARRTQDRRANYELRHALVSQMTEAASTFQFEAQRYRRAIRGRVDEGLDINELRRRLSEQYLKTRVIGETIENRLGGYFQSDRPRQLWHRTMDLASIMYFELAGMATDRIREMDAGPEHSGLSAEELKDLNLVIESFRRALREAVRAVLQERFIPAR